MSKKQPLINAITAAFASFSSIIIGLIAKNIFLRILGIEYLGLNGLFSNIIAALGILELGFGTAIIYNMYRPIANHDHETTKSLMRFYKKAYRIIALAVLLIGLSIIPFLPFFIKEVTIPINVTIIYILFILDVVASYILSYKRSILYVHQKNNIVSLVHIGYLIFLNIAQLTALAITKNYYLYLIIKIFAVILENLVITFIANKKYPYITEPDVKKLDPVVEKDIFKKIRAMFFHKIGKYIVLGTDNIIISKYLGLATVGLYSNYQLILSSMDGLIGQGISALTPTVGHMLITKSEKETFDSFKKIRFINFWLAAISGCCLLVAIPPFISLWIGQEYLLSTITLIVLIFIYFQNLMRWTYNIFKEAAGIFHEDRFVPLIESMINIVASILLVKLIGLPGVFIGTIISSFALWCYSYPKFVYAKIFKRSYLQYIKETLGYVLLFIAVSAISYFATLPISSGPFLLQIILRLIITFIISNFLLIIIFRKNPYLIQFTSKIKNLVKYLLALFKYHIIIKPSLKKLHILSAAGTIKKVNQGYSLARYGDGEFNIILNNPTPAFQPYSKSLSDKLAKTLDNHHEKLLLCIPKAFQNLSPYTFSSKRFYIEFLSKNWHKIKPYLNSSCYGDTNISRIYIDYKSKQGTKKRIADLKTIWHKKDIVIIEGNKTFFGINNDLLDNCKSIKRIICPSTNAFKNYAEILETAKQKIKPGTLVLIALGPTATILAADLANLGYQAIDIGHLDIEYEWYLKNATEKEFIPGKAVNETARDRQKTDRTNLSTTAYQNSIIAKISEESL